LGRVGDIVDYNDLGDDLDVPLSNRSESPSQTTQEILNDLVKRVDSLEIRQTDLLLIDMEELAKYIKIAIEKLKDIGSEVNLFEVKQIQKEYGDAHGYLTCFDQLQEAGLNARMAITVLFSIMNVMNRFEKKIIYNEENR